MIFVIVLFAQISAGVTIIEDTLLLTFCPTPGLASLLSQCGLEFLRV